MGFAVLNPSYELRVAGWLIGRPFELQEFGRRFGLHVVSDPAGQPLDASPQFRVGDPAERRDKPDAFNELAKKHLSVGLSRNTSF